MTARAFSRYPDYKDSGVAWLGEIPAHWEVKMLKRLAAMQAGSAITSESIEPSGDYPVFGGNGSPLITGDQVRERGLPSAIASWLARRDCLYLPAEVLIVSRAIQSC
jgi:hypothetical protein